MAILHRRPGHPPLQLTQSSQHTGTGINTQRRCPDKQQGLGEGTTSAVSPLHGESYPATPLSASSANRKTEKPGEGKSRRQGSGCRRTAARGSASEILRKFPLTSRSRRLEHPRHRQPHIPRASRGSRQRSPAAGEAERPADAPPAGLPRDRGSLPGPSDSGAGAASLGRSPRGRPIPMLRSPPPPTPPPRGHRPAEGPGKVRLFPGLRGVPPLPTPRGSGLRRGCVCVWAGPARPVPSLTSAAAPPGRSRRPPRSAWGSAAPRLPVWRAPASPAGRAAPGAAGRAGRPAAAAAGRCPRGGRPPPPWLRRRRREGRRRAAAGRAAAGRRAAGTAGAGGLRPLRPPLPPPLRPGRRAAVSRRAGRAVGRPGRCC